MPSLINFPARIETRRLAIRPWRSDDADALWHAVDESRDRLDRYMPWAKLYTAPSAASDFIARSNAKARFGYELPLAIFQRPSGRLLGACGFHSTEPTATGWRSLETGYWLRDGEEGKGYMREAVRAQIRLAFELGVERLQLLCDTRNEPSFRVAEACGFQLEAILRHDTRTHHDELRDTRVHAILAADAPALIASWPDEPCTFDWSAPPFERPALIHPPDTVEQTNPAVSTVMTESLQLDRVLDFDREMTFTIVDRAQHRHLGLAELVARKPDVPSYFIRWQFSSEDVPIDFVTETGLALVKIACEGLGAERVELRIPTSHDRDREVAEIIGGVEEGTLRAYRSDVDGSICDFVVYSILRREL